MVDLKGRKKVRKSKKQEIGEIYNQTVSFA